MSDGLNLTDREALFSRLGETSYDVAVIGGGITGAGVARDAAMRGLRVVLLEARDFASGTSSRSTKLIHGGIRYLAQGHVGLVREAARERLILNRIAPHLARRMPVVLPAASWATYLKLRIGVVAFEALGRVAAADRHQSWSLARLAEEVPSLRQDDLVAAIVYTEYLTDDARLTLANIRSAHDHGAVVANYTEVTGIKRATGGTLALDYADTAPDTNQRGRITAKTVVNAGGPWVDQIRRLEDSQAAPRLALSKGIHLVFPRSRIPLDQTIFMTAGDGRVGFIVPRAHAVYVGTTDTFYPNSDYWPSVDASDIDYLLDAANRNLAIAPLTRADIINQWSGIRPLVAAPGKSPSEISRRDEIMDGPMGMITIAGGKLTAYRRMAERIVDRCVDRLQMKARPCTTGDEPLPGGNLTQRIAELGVSLESSGIDTVDGLRLARLYGSEAHRIVADGGDVAAEVRHAVHDEGAVTLEDYWLRRSARGLFDLDGGRAALAQAAPVMAALLGWSDAALAAQLDSCAARLPV